MKNLTIRGQSAELLIYDAIGADFFGEGVTAKGFREELFAHADVDELTVRINSDGGDVFEGFSIYEALADHPAKVTAKVDGVAASIASVVMMAADEVEVAENAFVYVHGAWGSAVGYADELRERANLLDSVTAKIRDVYVARTNQPEGQVDEWLSGDGTWFNAEQAVEFGFADRMTERLRVAARLDPSKFPRVPKRLLAQIEPVAEQDAEIVADSVTAADWTGTHERRSRLLALTDPN